MKQKPNDRDIKANFKVPEHYFEELPMRIQHRLATQRKPLMERKVISWSLVTSVCAVVLFTINILWQSQGSSADDILAQVSEEDLMEYIGELNLDHYDLASAFPQTTRDFKLGSAQLLDELDINDFAIEDIIEEYDLELENFIP